MHPELEPKSLPRSIQKPASVEALIGVLLLLVLSLSNGSEPAPADRSLSWPAITRQAKPWAYWWWMGSAVDKSDLKRELKRYHDAGLGGVHIIPIYGAKGYEKEYIDYLSPAWMDMLRYTVTEADRLDMGVDMTTGTGWCFGGPQVTDAEANASVIVQTFELAPGTNLAEKLDPRATQAVVAFSPGEKPLDLTVKITPEGHLDWTPETGHWVVYAVSQRPSGQKVKRAAPGGQGYMLNLFYAPAMTHYLQRFDQAFAGYQGLQPRAMYHDSYEYRSDWAPELFCLIPKAPRLSTAR